MGFEGQELNRFYDRTDDGVVETHEHIVEAGTGVAMLPDDLHSIHIDGPALELPLLWPGARAARRARVLQRPSERWKSFSQRQRHPRSRSAVLLLLMHADPVAASITLRRSPSWLLDGDEIAATRRPRTRRVLRVAPLPCSVHSAVAPRTAAAIARYRGATPGSSGATTGRRTRRRGRRDAGRRSWAGPNCSVLDGGTAGWAAAVANCTPA